MPIGGETDGEIPFPPDPTEGEGVEVKTCCDPGIEMAGLPGAIEGVESCTSACAHAACNEAIARFQAMLDDPGTWASCLVLTPPFEQYCIDRVKESLEYYKGFLTNNFADCVLSVTDGPAVFNMLSPGCTEDDIKTGCLSAGVLDMSCNAVSIDFDSNSGQCTEALHQPPAGVTKICEVDTAASTLQIADGNSRQEPAVELGGVQTLYFPCAETLCPFVMEGLRLEIEDINAGSLSYQDLEVELYTAAIGQSDGTDVEFPAGAIRIHVSGNIVGLSGSTPFSVLAASSEVTTGTHDNDVLVLNSVLFEAGAYTFNASLSTEECEAQ